MDRLNLQLAVFAFVLVFANGALWGYEFGIERGLRDGERVGRLKCNARTPSVTNHALHALRSNDLDEPTWHKPTAAPVEPQLWFAGEKGLYDLARGLCLSQPTWRQVPLGKR